MAADENVIVAGCSEVDLNEEEPKKDELDLLKELPPEFVQFLRDNGVPLEAYCKAAAGPLPRFVRVNPQGQLVAQTGEQQPHKACAKALAEALGLASQDAVQPIEWLNSSSLSWTNVYSCPSNISLAQNEAFKNGDIYGIDAASVFAVRCLDPQPGDCILDLCCAPGAKLCTLCDAVTPSGQVVGVDLAEQRLAACRTVLRKYKLTNARLALGDGTSWDPQSAAWMDLNPPRGRGQRGRKRRLEAAAAATAVESREESVPSADCFDSLAEENIVEIGVESASKTESSSSSSTNQFDRVLVDAECTHDGSLRHIEKFRSQWGWQTLGDRVPWLKQDGLYELQLGLLSNGFRLLREGGTLVYSTCSLCRRQNEDVVDAFLKQEPLATLSPLPVQLRCADANDSCAAPARPSLLEDEQGPLGSGEHFCTARFDPSTSGTSGLFIARLTRLPRSSTTDA